MEALSFLLERGGYSDVVREAQELVDLLLKGVLRSLGEDVPKVHDVSRQLLAAAERMPVASRADLGRGLAISKRLRKERELAFYGAEDFIPTEEYERADAEDALADATFVWHWATDLLLGEQGGPGGAGPA